MHRNLRTMIAASGLAVVALLGVAGCGSDNGSSAGTTSAGGSGGDDSDLCRYAKDLEESTDSSTFSNMDEATFEKIEGIITNVQAKAPDEIKDDVAVVAENFQGVREIFAKYDFDVAKL